MKYFMMVVTLMSGLMIKVVSAECVGIDNYIAPEELLSTCKVDATTGEDDLAQANGKQAITQSNFANMDTKKRVFDEAVNQLEKEKPVGRHTIRSNGNSANAEVGMRSPFVDACQLGYLSFECSGDGG